MAGIGSTYHYRYNFTNQYLETENGEQTEFTRYFNHVEADLTKLNGFDGQLEKDVHSFLDSAKKKNNSAFQDIKQDNSGNQIIEFTVTIDDIWKSTVASSSCKAIRLTGVSPTRNQLDEMEDPDFSSGYKKYDKQESLSLENNLVLNPGDIIPLKEGYQLSIENNRVRMLDSDGMEVSENSLKKAICHQMDWFLWYSSGVISASDLKEKSGNDLSILKEVLNNLGIDISKPFTVNGITSKFTEEGNIVECGNIFGYSHNLYQEFLSEQEYWMNQTLLKLQEK